MKVHSLSRWVDGAVDDADERLVARWKSMGLQMYFEPTTDEEGRVVFTDGGFTYRVEAARGNVPILMDEDREMLTMFMDEREASPQAGFRR